MRLFCRMNSSRSARFRFWTQGMQNPSFAIAVVGKIVFVQPWLRQRIRSTGIASFACFPGILQYILPPSSLPSAPAEVRRVATRERLGVGWSAISGVATRRGSASAPLRGLKPTATVMCRSAAPSLRDGLSDVTARLTSSRGTGCPAGPPWSLRGPPPSAGVARCVKSRRWHEPALGDPR